MIRIPISTANSGDTTLVAAPTPAHRRIRVLHYHIVAAGAVVAKFKSGSTDITGTMTMATGIPVPGGPSQRSEGINVGVLECNAGEALVLNLAAAVQVSGHLVYELVG